MAKTNLRAGAELDVLTRDELAETIDKQTRDWFQEQARGVSIGRFKDAAAVAGSAVALPALGALPYGPRLGYLWDVKRITVTGLTGTDTVSVFRSTTNAVDLLDTFTVTKPTIYPKGIRLRGADAEKLLFSGSSLAATGFVSVNGEADEVAETDFYKVLRG
jgi:hypothetical protein